MGSFSPQYPVRARKSPSCYAPPFGKRSLLERRKISSEGTKNVAPVTARLNFMRGSYSPSWSSSPFLGNHAGDLPISTHRQGDRVMVSKTIAASEGVDRVVEISRRNCRNSLSLLERRQE